MSPQEPVPALSGELSFSRSFFGFDPLEVRAHLAKLHDRLARLEERNQPDPSGNGAAANHDVSVAIDAAVDDIAEVLEAARVAARKIRDRARRDATDGSAEAAREARRILSSAEADAFSVRKSAWDTSTELLESAKAEGVRMRNAAERDVLEIIADAERKAHRKLAASRRDSDSTLQMAHAESDRLIGIARAKAREIIEVAEDRASKILDRVSRLEKSHEEVRSDVDDIEKRQEDSADEAARLEISTVRIVNPESSMAAVPATNGEPPPQETAEVGLDAGPEPGRWADGTRNVCLVPAPSSKEGGPERAGPVTGTSTGEPAPGDPHQDGNRQPAPDPARGISLPAAQEPEARTDSPRLRTATLTAVPTDELDALFKELRVKEPATTAGVTPEPDGAGSLPELYDLVLLPIVNRAVRGVKRQLTDLQREQIKALEHDPDGWDPQRSDFAPYVVHAVSVMEREAYERGYSAAAEISGTRLTSLRGEVGRGEGDSFIDALFDGVATAIRNARELERSGRDVSSDLSGMFRRWRTEEAERRLRGLAGRAYHRGLVKGLSSIGMDRFLMVIEDGCDTCTPFSGEVMTAADLPTVPVNDGCRCTVVPA